MPRGVAAVAILAALVSLAVLAGCGQFAERQRDPEKSEPRRSATVAKEGSAYDPGELAGTEWELVPLNGHDLVKGTSITLDFEDDVMSGNAGCNLYGTDTVQADRGTFKTVGFDLTAMGCGGAVGRQEVAYLRTLEKAATYRRRGERLEIRNAAGETTLVYEQRPQYRSDPADLVGTEWMLRSTDGRPPEEGSTPTLSFDSEKKFSGYDGCRHFYGMYEADADDISFPNIGMEEWACMKPDLGVEYEGAPGGFPPDGDYRLGEGRLEISRSSGRVNVYVPLREGVNSGRPEASWRLEKFVEGGKVTPVSRGTEITLSFDRGTLRETGTVSGSAGCNDYSFDYVLRGDYVYPDSVAVTKRACTHPAGGMEQEERYLSLLEEAHGYARTARGRLEVYAREGERKLVFAPPG